MKLAKFALASAILLATSLFATNAFADIDIRAGINFSAIGITEDSTQSDYYGYYHRQHLEFEDPMIGVTGTLSLGYRWSIIGLYIEQDIGGLWWTGYTSTVEGYNYEDASILGGTYATVKLILPLGSTDIDLGLGLGAMYSTGAKHDEPQDSYAIIIDRNMDPSAAFAIRFTMGFTHFFGDFIGIGLHFDYNVGFNYVTPNRAIWGDIRNYESTVHQINPGLHLQIKI